MNLGSCQAKRGICCAVSGATKVNSRSLASLGMTKQFAMFFAVFPRGLCVLCGERCLPLILQKSFHVFFPFATASGYTEDNFQH
jgi:hypothetical protein